MTAKCSAFFYLPATRHIKNTAISTATIIAPTGAETSSEINIPSAVHTTDKTPEHIITDLKLLKIRIADSAGKIISAEVSSDPAIRIANTITTAVTTAIKVL